MTKITKPAENQSDWGVFEGRAWVFGDSIDTDQIISTRHYILKPAEMIKHVLETVKPALHEKIKPGDVIIAGRNFGCGSSREQAVFVLKELKLGAVVAHSFARIFYRNAINLALPVLECKDLDPNEFQDGDRVKVDVRNGEITNIKSGKKYSLTKFPELVVDIMKAGGLINYMIENDPA